MKKTAVYLSLGIAAASAGAIAVAAIEEVPGMLKQAIDRAVAAALQQQPDQKVIRVGGSGA
jgi:hypothetical protein